MFQSVYYSILLTLLALGNFLIKVPEFIYLQLVAIHNGTMVAKFKSTLVIAVMASPITILDSIYDWINTNNGYILFVFSAIIIDWVIGSIVHAFIIRDFSIKKNAWGIITKSMLVICAAVLFEGLTFINGEDSFMTETLGTITRLMVFLYPAGSALMNISVISKGRFPPTGFIDWLKNFNKTLNPKLPKNESDGME